MIKLVNLLNEIKVNAPNNPVDSLKNNYKVGDIYLTQDLTFSPEIDEEINYFDKGIVFAAVFNDRIAYIGDIYMENHQTLHALFIPKPYFELLEIKTDPWIEGKFEDIKPEDKIEIAKPK